MARGQPSWVRITSSPTQTPFGGPIIEVPNTIRSTKFYTNEEFEEEEDKSRAAQVDVAIKFEEKIKDTILFLINRIERPIFYKDLVKIINILNELRNSESTIR